LANQELQQQQQQQQTGDDHKQTTGFDLKQNALLAEPSLKLNLSCNYPLKATMLLI